MFTNRKLNDGDVTGAMSFVRLKTLVMHKNVFNDQEGSVKIIGNNGAGNKITTCSVLHNQFYGKATMLSDAALQIVNCDAITLTGNYFTNIGTISSNTMGEATAFKAFSSEPWSLNARFNLFYDNNAGIHIVTGVHSSHQYRQIDGGDRDFVIPTGKIEYNQFNDGPVNAQKGDIVMADISEDSSYFGFLTT